MQIVKYKLKKRFRHWRKFKFLFLKRNKKISFIKLKWMLNYKRIIWHQMIVIYSKQIKKLIYSKTTIKRYFNKSFFNFLIILERRLNIVLLRLRLFTKLLQINKYLYLKKVYVNTSNKKYNYLLKKNDLLNCFSCFTPSSTNLFKLLKWRHYKWRKWRFYSISRNGLNLFNLSKRNIICNYVEINYKVFSAIYLRHPTLGEIVLNNNKRIININILKKFYYYY